MGKLRIRSNKESNFRVSCEKYSAEIELEWTNESDKCKTSLTTPLQYGTQFARCLLLQLWQCIFCYNIIYALQKKTKKITNKTNIPAAGTGCRADSLTAPNAQGALFYTLLLTIFFFSYKWCNLSAVPLRNDKLRVFQHVQLFAAYHWFILFMKNQKYRHEPIQRDLNG